MSKSFENCFAGHGYAASYSRFSSDQQGERSIQQQENAQDDVAKRNGHKFGVGMRFRDEAVSGTKRNRKGLNAMEQAAKEGKFKVLYLYNVSRLARESVIAMPLLKRLVNKYGVRVISVSDGVDSTNENWVMYSSILAVIAEQYLKDLANNVHRGQSANASSGHSNGGTFYGYKSVPDPKASPQGRDRRIPKIHVIYEELAQYVVMIFHWFVVERRRIRWIVRELNRIGAPRRSPSEKRKVMWRHQYVTKILKNVKYIGIWPWGETKIVRDPETGDVKRELRLPEEIEGWVFENEKLRIIEVEIFKRAQILLLEQAEKSKPLHAKNGKFKKPGVNRRDLGPKHLLSGLLFCAECGRAYNKAGGHGNYYQCSGYPTGKCGSYTQLKQERGEAMILKVIEDHMLVDGSWRELVWKATEKAWHAARVVVPTDSSGLKSRLTDVTKRINTLVNLITDGEVIPEFSQKLAELRSEKQDLLGQIEENAHREDTVKTPLTRENVMADLTRLHDVLRSATPAAAFALRTLVGGRIDLEQVVATGKKRGFVRGTFKLQVRAYVDGALTGDSIDVTIDFVEPNGEQELQDRVRELLKDNTLAIKDIAIAVGIGHSKLDRVLKAIAKQDGIVIDGKARRSERERLSNPPTQAERLADEVKILTDQGLLLGVIAERLEVGPDVVTLAFQHWYRSRNLPVPDGRARRKTLDVKQRPVDDDKAA